MSDQYDDWWSGSTTPAPPPPGGHAPATAPPPDATVVLPAGPPSQAPPPAPAYGNQPPPPLAAQPYGVPAYGVPAYGVPAYGVPGAGGPASKPRATGGAVMMLIGAVLAAVGTALPWFVVDGIDLGDLPNGFDTYFFGDVFDPVEWSNPGAYVIATMGFVALMAVIVLAAGKSTAASVLGILTTLLAGLVGLSCIAVVANLIGDVDGLNFGPGVAMVGLGSLVALVGSILVAAKR